MTTDKNILIHNIYYMLAYAFRYFRLNLLEEMQGEKFEDIQDLFAEILIRCVSDQIKQGMYRTYVSKEGTLPVIRGKIDLLKTQKVQQSKPLYACCQYDELSFNNPYNQVVKTTLQCLLYCSNVSVNRKHSIRHILRYFISIDSMSLSSVQWNKFVFDGNNQSYQFLINICRFLHEEKIMTTEKGVYKLKSLSDNQMARLFEKFVLEYYKRHHPETKPRAAKIEWDIIKEESTVSILPIMLTDIMLNIGERTLIIDTKYIEESMKSYFNKSEIDIGHLRQIHFYVSEYDKEKLGKVNGVLLYAKTQEIITPYGQMKLPTWSTIYFRTLDLNQDFEEIANQLDQLINLGGTILEE